MTTGSYIAPPSPLGPRQLQRAVRQRAYALSWQLYQRLVQLLSADLAQGIVQQDEIGVWAPPVVRLRD